MNLAALSLWLSWRSHHLDPLARPLPVTLVGTLRRAERRRLEGWLFLPGLLLLLALRALLYREIGAPAGWNPKLDLGPVVLAFRSDLLLPSLAYSALSFLRVATVFYFWLLVLVNRGALQPDPIQKLVRLQLGRLGRWPWPIQLALSIGWVLFLWVSFQPVLVRLGVITPVHTWAHLLEQGLLIWAALLLSLKYLLPIFLLLHLVASYVYLGSNPLWEFISATATRLLAPLRPLPLRFARLDLAPVLGVILIFLLLDWMPGFIILKLAQQNLSLWPQ
ncbi:MAG TPA: hypothetical protein VG146_23250 [Verrucomicrobiae bacterium]|nr:hypothetical protein [Verrucomicrobiae bacterium]